MNIKKLKYATLLIFVMAICHSCLYEDLGNYNYKEINDIKVDGIISNAYYTVMAHVDTLVINPEVTFSLDKGDPDRYTYEWSLLPTISSKNDTVIKIGNARELSWPVVLAAGTYIGYYKIYDKKGDLTWTTNFFVKCVTITNTGWIVLCKENDRARIDMIVHITENKTVVAKNILVGAEHPGKPVGLSFALADPTIGDSETILYGENGSFQIRLDGSDNFMTDASTDCKYEMMSGAPRVDIRAAAKTFNRTKADEQATVMVDKNGDLFIKYNWKERMYGFRRNMNPDKAKEFVRMAPFVGVRWGSMGNEANSIVLLYDRDNSRFMQLIAGDDTLRNLDIAGCWGSAQTDGYEMVGMTNTNLSRTDSKCICFMKSGNGDVYLYGADLKANSVTIPVVKDRLKFPAGVSPTCFTHQLRTNVAICAAGNKVYRSAEWSMGESKDLVMKVDEKIVIPDDEVIVDLKFHTRIGRTKREIWETSDQYKLVVASNKQIGSIDEDGEVVTEENCGRIRFYEVESVTSTKELDMYRGLGYIVGITYKERNKN